MSLEIKEGINSFCSLDFAEDYLSSDYSWGSSWDSLTSPSKARLLITSTNFLNKLIYKGSKVDLNQPLAFPRKFDLTNVSLSYFAEYYDYYNTFNFAGYQQYNYIIPIEVKKAQCEYAKSLFLYDTNTDLQNLIDMGIGNIKIDTLQFSEIKSKSEMPKAVSDLLIIFLDVPTNKYYRA
jgi:hypothetical protein